MKMKKKPAARRALALPAALGLALAAGGCAVMTIDVDVYKGPLANHKDVQVEQMAVMAVGAERLLDHLLQVQRGKLVSISPADSEFRGKLIDGTETEGLDHCDLSNSVNGETGNGGGSSDPFRRYLTRKLKLPGGIKIEEIQKVERRYALFAEVRAVRCLFRNRKEKGAATATPAAGQPAKKEIRDVQLFAREFERLQQRLNKFSHILVPGSLTERQRKLAGALRDSARYTRRAHNLAGAYLGFLNPVGGQGFRPWADIFYFAGIAAKSNSELYGGFDRNSFPTPISKSNAPRSSSNEAFDALSRRSFLAAHAAFLFPDSSENQELFIDEIGAIARSFLTVRETIAAMLVETLHALASSDGFEFKRTEDKNRAIFDLARGAAQLIQVEHLRMALDGPAGDTNVSSITSRLKERLPQLVSFESYGDWKDPDLRPAVERALAETIAAEPVAMGDALLNIHGRFKKELRLGNLTIVSRRNQQKFEDAIRRKYGLARGPLREAPSGVGGLADEGIALEGEIVEGESVKLISEFAGNMIEGFPGLGTPFAGGRLDDGLIKMIEDYLKARDGVHESCQQDDCNLNYRRNRLFDSLVHFATKVLPMANNVLLFPDPENDTSVDAFVRVLQTVGNSILVQADAIKRETEHGKRLVESGPAQAAAIRLAFGDDPKTVYGRLLESLDGELARAKAAKTQTTKAEAEAQKASLAAVQAVRNAEAVLAVTPKVDAATKPPATGDMKKFAAIWASLGEDPKSLDPVEGGAADPSDAAGKAAIEAVMALAADVDAFYESIRTALQSEKNTAIRVGNADRAARLDLAHQVLGVAAFKTKATTTPVPASKPQLLVRLREMVKTKYAEAKAPFLILKTDFDRRVGARTEAEAALTAALADAAKKQAALAATTASKTGVEHSVAQITNAKAETVNARDSVLKALAGGSAGGVGVKKALIQHLQATLETATAVTSAPLGSSPPPDPKRDAIAVLGTIEEPTGLPENFGQGKNALEVFNDLITVLGREKIRLIKDGAPEATKTAAAEALVEAYRQRQDMIHIRPAVTYLRTSFAATTLQDNRGAAWKNMLARHGVRSWPLIGEHLTNSNPEELAVQREIDKQFWQNINRVRVAGAGATNYAIAKDDIGNWYVKSYAADTESIIKSARNQALFNLGPQLGGVDLLERVNKEDGAVPTAADRPRLARVFDRHRETYETAATADFDTPVQLLGETGLRKRIDDGWSDLEDGDRAKLKAKLDAAFKVHADDRAKLGEKKNLKGGDASPQDLSDKIPGGVRLALRFFKTFAADLPGTLTRDAKLAEETQVAAQGRAEDELAAERKELKRLEASRTDANAATLDPQIAQNKLDIETSEGNVETERAKTQAATMAVVKAGQTEESALKKAASITEATLRDFLAKRQNANDAYRNAITFVGEAAAPASAGSPESQVPAAATPSGG